MILYTTRDSSICDEETGGTSIAKTLITATQSNFSSFCFSVSSSSLKKSHPTPSTSLFRLIFWSKLLQTTSYSVPTTTTTTTTWTPMPTAITRFSLRVVSWMDRHPSGMNPSSILLPITSHLPIPSTPSSRSWTTSSVAVSPSTPANALLLACVKAVQFLSLAS